MKHTSLSACLIVKNEAQNLAACLQSIAAVVDEIIVVDTGSTDQTREIAARFTSKLYHFDWCDDYGQARNAALQYASCDWTLILNGDERLDAASAPLIQPTIQAFAYHDPVVLLFRLLTPGDQTRFVRGLFPNHRGLRFKGRVHEWLIWPDGPLQSVECPELIVHHRPHYPADKYSKDKRLMLLDLPTLSEPFERSLLLFHLGQTELRLNQPQEALKCFYDARAAFLSSGSVRQHRLYHNILEPLARLSLQHDQVEQGKTYAQELTALFPQFTEGWLFLAYATFWLGQLAEAEDHYQRVISQLNNPQLPDPVRWRCSRLARLGLTRIALLSQRSLQGNHELHRLHMLQPQPETDLHLARSCLLLQQTERARRIYTQIMGQPVDDLPRQLLAADIWSPLERQQLQEMMAYV